jgi:hypothetical protein
MTMPLSTTARGGRACMRHSSYYLAASFNFGLVLPMHTTPSVQDSRPNVDIFRFIIFAIYLKMIYCSAFFS